MKMQPRILDYVQDDKGLGFAEAIFKAVNHAAGPRTRNDENWLEMLRSNCGSLHSVRLQRTPVGMTVLWWVDNFVAS
jgi:hypothetical protein